MTSLECENVIAHRLDQMRVCVCAQHVCSPIRPRAVNPVGGVRMFAIQHQRVRTSNITVMIMAEGSSHAGNVGVVVKSWFLERYIEKYIIYLVRLVFYAYRLVIRYVRLFESFPHFKTISCGLSPGWMRFNLELIPYTNLLKTLLFYATNMISLLIDYYI